MLLFFGGFSFYLFYLCNLLYRIVIVVYFFISVCLLYCLVIVYLLLSTVLFKCITRLFLYCFVLNIIIIII